MQRLALSLWCVVLSSGFAWSQNYPKAEVFGGYSYINIDTNGLSSRQNANGWEAGASGNFNQWVAAEFDVNGYYKTILGVNVTDYSYAAGPRINFRPIFLHALFGADHLTGSASGTSESQDGFAGIFGGGVQRKVSGPWSVRASADYVFTHHNIFGGPLYTQNNFRAGAGIVYSFGGQSSPRTHTAGRSPEQVSESHPSMPIPSLGIMASPRPEGGAVIVVVSPGSVAHLANLQVGYVIMSVDGKPVKSPMELAAELQNRASGSQVHLGYLFRSGVLGEFTSETTVILGSNK